MIINGKSIQGLFVYNENYGYERGDFVVYNNSLYRCIAESDTVVSSRPDEDSKNFEEYPGSRIKNKDSYNKALEDLESDGYVSSDLLNQILSDMNFGLGDTGLIESEVSYNTEDKKITYDIKDNQGEFVYGEKENILDSIMQGEGLNNGAVRISAALPDIENILPPKSTRTTLEPYYITGKVVDYGTGLGVSGVIVRECIYNISGSTSEVYSNSETTTDTNGEFTIDINSDTSRLEIVGPKTLKYITRYFDLSDDNSYTWDNESRKVTLNNSIKIQKEGPFYEVSGKVTDYSGNGLEGITVSIDNQYQSWIKVKYGKALNKEEEEDLIKNYIEFTYGDDRGEFVDGKEPENDEGLKESIRKNQVYKDSTNTYGIFTFDGNNMNDPGEGGNGIDVNEIYAFNNAEESLSRILDRTYCLSLDAGSYSIKVIRDTKFSFNINCEDNLLPSSEISLVVGTYANSTFTPVGTIKTWKGNKSTLSNFVKYVNSSSDGCNISLDSNTKLYLGLTFNLWSINSISSSTVNNVIASIDYETESKLGLVATRQATEEVSKDITFSHRGEYILSNEDWGKFNLTTSSTSTCDGYYCDFFDGTDSTTSFTPGSTYKLKSISDIIANCSDTSKEFDIWKVSIVLKNGDNDIIRLFGWNGIKSPKHINQVRISQNCDSIFLEQDVVDEDGFTFEEGYSLGLLLYTEPVLTINDSNIKISLQFDQSDSKCGIIFTETSSTSSDEETIIGTGGETAETTMSNAGFAGFVKYISTHFTNYTYSTSTAYDNVLTDSSGNYTLTSSSPILGVRFDDYREGDITNRKRSIYEKVITDTVNTKMMSEISSNMNIFVKLDSTGTLYITKYQTGYSYSNFLDEEADGDVVIYTGAENSLPTNGIINLTNVLGNDSSILYNSSPVFLSYFPSSTDYISIINSPVLQNSSALIGEADNLIISLPLQKSNTETEVSSFDFLGADDDESNISGLILVNKGSKGIIATSLVSEYNNDDQKLIIIAKEGYKGGIYNIVSEEASDYPINDISTSYRYSESYLDTGRKSAYVILRQFTYEDFKDDTDKYYTRIQEIIDPQYGNIVYRMCRTKDNSSIDFKNVSLGSWKSATCGNITPRERLISLENLYTKRCNEVSNYKNLLKGKRYLCEVKLNNDTQKQVQFTSEEYTELSSGSLIVTFLLKKNIRNNLYRTYTLTVSLNLDNSAEEEYIYGADETDRLRITTIKDTKTITAEILGNNTKISNVYYEKEF